MEYTFNSPRLQNFSIPTFMVKYITTQNPNGLDSYGKIYQTCKYFFASNPFCFFINEFFDDSECTIDPVQKSIRFQDVTTLDLTRAKLWLKVSYLFWHTEDRKTLSYLMPLSFRIEAEDLRYSHQDLTVDEFKMLTSQMIYLDMENSHIYKPNGDVLSISETLAMVPNIEYFSKTFHLDEPVTPLGDIHCFKQFCRPSGKLKCLHFQGIRANKDFTNEDYVKLMKVFQQCKLRLDFRSEEDAMACKVAILKAFPNASESERNLIKIGENQFMFKVREYRY